MTYGELEAAIRSLAGGLAAAGFGRGDVLALMAPNGPEYAVVFHGAAMAGGTVTTINPAYTQAEVHHQLADSGARILNNPQATEATVDAAGWLRTGDLGYVDADGHLYVVDRLKELIKYKGFQVPPAELEAVLLRHPDVADAAVIGLPDDEAGEIPAGYVVLRPGAAASPEEIMRFVAGEVAHYKQIRRLEVIDAIPKSAAGKTLRRLLRDSART